MAVPTSGPKEVPARNTSPSFASCQRVGRDCKGLAQGLGLSSHTPAGMGAWTINGRGGWPRIAALRFALRCGSPGQLVQTVTRQTSLHIARFLRGYDWKSSRALPYCLANCHVWRAPLPRLHWNPDLSQRLRDPWVSHNTGSRFAYRLSPPSLASELHRVQTTVAWNITRTSHMHSQTLVDSTAF